MLAWRLNAGFGTSEYRLLQPYLSCMIERAPTRGRNRRGDWIRSHAWEGSESKHVEWKAARVDGHMHGRTVKARMSNREPRAWMDTERMHVERSLCEVKVSSKFRPWVTRGKHIIL